MGRPKPIRAKVKEREREKKERFREGGFRKEEEGEKKRKRGIKRKEREREREKSNERRSSPLAHSHYPCPTLPLPSLFGKTIEAKSKRVNCRIVDNLRAIKRSFDRFDIQRTIEISNNAAISIHHKKTELVDTCIYIG